MKKFRLVIVESPYQGEVERNAGYAVRAMADCCRRDEAPFASHILYALTGITDDNDRAQRAIGIEMGLAWGRAADATVCYVDHGISPGMLQGIGRAVAEGRPVEYRYLETPHKNDPPDHDVVIPTRLARRERVAELLLEMMGVELGRRDLPDWRDVDVLGQNALLRAAVDVQELILAYADLADRLAERKGKRS